MAAGSNLSQPAAPLVVSVSVSVSVSGSGSGSRRTSKRSSKGSSAPSSAANKYYIVWFDLNNMQGSVNDAMAEAVENAEVVLFGVSNRYKESGANRNTHPLQCHFLLETITLPRQARDKHRESSKRDAFFPQQTVGWKLITPTSKRNR